MDDQELYIDSVQHSFGKRKILSGVYLNCRSGEVVGILGRNGSGKTTLLKIIFGSLRAEFKFQRIGDKQIKTGYQTGFIAYLPQQNFVPGKLTVMDAINFFCSIYKKRMLETGIIKEHLHQRFNQLSGGEKRVIECLLILYSDAKFVLLDEPFSQLSPIFIEELQKHIHLLKSEKGFLITDHYYEQIASVATRMVLLHNGSNYTVKSQEDLILYGYLPERRKTNDQRPK